METLLIALAAAVAYIVAYHTYGRWLSKRVFQLDPNALVPSVELRDDQDYVPTPKSIVFGHHFTSIAGTGPIVGPALAVMWGWLPALLWVLLGSIFMGAVHDLGTLVVSLRSRGMTVGEIAGRVINPRVRLLFLTILLFALWIVLAIFGLVIAGTFKAFPESILPVFLQIPIAIWIGLMVHRRGKNILVPSAVALLLMYLTVWFGAACPGMEWTGGTLGSAIQSLNAQLASWPVWVWTAILLAYCYVASVIPVWVLLQPRDYINSLQLISSLALVVLGLVAAGLFGAGDRELTLVAPAVNFQATGAPSFVPFLFVTIACGAISGFHCLVSSGTSSKQIRCESDAQFVGYGSMLTEGFLAVLVIIAVSAGIGLGWDKFGGLYGSELWSAVYTDWNSVTKLTTAPFVVGAANIVSTLGIDPIMSKALIAVLVASFAGTTLDTATRLQRYVVQELAATVAPRMSPTALAAEAYDTEFDRGPVAKGFSLNPLVWLTNSHGATLFAVTTAFLLALFPGPGQPWTAETIGRGGLILWPLFGATNQLLGGLAFLVVCFWLWRRGKPIWFAAIPAIFMLIMPGWALIESIRYEWWPTGSYLLVAIAVGAILLEAWMVIEALLLWPKVRGVAEAPLPPITPRPEAKQPALATES